MRDVQTAKVLEQQELALVFPSFNEDTAFVIGSALREAAKLINSPVAIQIRSASRLLFCATLPGSAPENESWARRKGNVVLHCHASSWRIAVQLQNEGRSQWPDAALRIEEFAADGGGFPVRVEGMGVVAAIAVSGLPSREDHDLIVCVLKAHLNVKDCPVTP